MAESMTFDVLRDVMSGNAAAFRLTQRLQPAGGAGTKVFPPTHSGGVYAWEMRRVGKDEVLLTVLLDSVQSQANRLEQALLEAYRAGSIKLPIMQTDFSKDFPDIGMVTTLDAPHRIADAIFRESTLDGIRFRDSDIGKAFESANIHNATALFQYCPHALVFGVWDSTGSAGGLGNKFQRVVVSEIIGIDAQKGVRTSSRIDPILKRNPDLYEDEEGNFTFDPDKAKKDKDDKPKKFGKKLSELNLGNVTPDFVRYDPKEKKPLRTMDGEIRVGDVLHGGVTIDHAMLTEVLSLPALRRLRFPVNGTETPEQNNAARTVLAALALAAITHQREQGYDLRSRCLLVPDSDSDTPFELVANNGKTEAYSLTAEQVDKIFAQAVDQAQSAGLRWQQEEINLVPEERLVELVRKSRAAVSSVGE